MRTQSLLISVALVVSATPATAMQIAPVRTALPDGVEHYSRPMPAAGKPWFFNQFERVTNLVLGDRSQLPFDRSVAFVVGVSRYAQLAPLPFVRNDVEDMTRYLLAAGGFDEVYVARDDVASPALVQRYMVDKFRRELGQRDRLLFYYAGHGADLNGTTGYMQFGRATPGVFSENVLEMDKAREWSAVIPARHILFVFDACSSGLSEPSSRVAPDYEERLVSALSGTGSRIVITAGTADEETYEVRQNGRGNGVFTRALLDALRENTRLLTVEQVYAGVLTRIAEFAVQSRKQLSPNKWSLDARKGTFVFLNPDAADAPLPERYRTVLGARSRGNATSPTIDREWPLDARAALRPGPAWTTNSHTGEWGVVKRTLEENRYTWDFNLVKPQIAYALSPVGSLSDFSASVDVDVELPAGKCCMAAGLVFRSSAYGTGYEFRISSRGAYWLARSGPNQVTSLIDWTNLPASLLRQRSHQLSIRVSGDTIRYSIDGVRLGSVVDQTHAVGEIGLIAEGDSGMQGRVHFSNFQIRPKPAGPIERIPTTPIDLSGGSSPPGGGDATLGTSSSEETIKAAIAKDAPKIDSIIGQLMRGKPRALESRFQGNELSWDGRRSSSWPLPRFRNDSLPAQRRCGVDAGASASYQLFDYTCHAEFRSRAEANALFDALTTVVLRHGTGWRVTPEAPSGERRTLSIQLCRAEDAADGRYNNAARSATVVVDQAYQQTNRWLVLFTFRVDEEQNALLRGITWCS